MNTQESASPPTVLLETHPTCATCVHAELNPQDITMINCWGSPPIPVVVGGGQDQLGRMALNVQVLRPVSQPRTARGCALHKPKPAILR